MSIRVAKTEDFELIWPIFKAIASKGDTYAYPTDTTKDEAHHIWMEYPRETFVYEEGGKVLGTYYIKDNQPGQGNHICNCGYMVSKDARGKGIATKMCEHSQKIAVEYGYKGMQYNFVFSTNKQAVRLWKRLGYEVVGRLPKACCLNGSNYVDALVMYKWLDDSMNTPRLETERLVLRTFTKEDVNDVFKGWETDPDVAKYMMWESHNDINRTKEWLEMEIGRISDKDWFRWAIEEKATGRLIGTCLIYYNETEDSFVVGYNLSKVYWNKGFTTEAMQEVLRFAKEELKIKTISGSHSVENPASGKVMENLGMKFVKECDYICNGGKLHTKGCTYEIVLND